MRPRTPLRLAAALLLASAGADALASDHGAVVFAEACASCHLLHLSAEAADHADDLLAPPMNLLTTVLRRNTGNDEAAFVAHVTAFTFDPRVDKVKAMPESLDRFGLMPSVALTFPGLTRDDIAATATWLFHKYDYQRELEELLEHERLERTP